MTNSLIEKVARIMASQMSLAPFDKLSTNTKDAYKQKATPIVTAVLDHFSDPADISASMRNAFADAYCQYGVSHGGNDAKQTHIDSLAAAIAAAMKAARGELK